MLNLRVIKFIGVGGIATAIHGLIYSGFLAADLGSAYIANTLAYVVAVLFSYVGQRYATFSDYDLVPSKLRFVKFIGASLLGFTINSGWVFMVVDIFALSAYYSLLGIVGLTPVITFLLLKFWVFGNGR
jgi:putative flippase GtrA